MRIWERHWRSLAVVGGTTQCLTLPCPSECHLEQLRIIQTGGPTSDFEVRIFNADIACRGGASSSGGADPEGTYEASPELYQVGPTLQGVAGILEEDFEDRALAFLNMDSTLHVSKLRRLYLEITPSEPGDMAFDVGLRVHTDVG